MSRLRPVLARGLGTFAGTVLDILLPPYCALCGPRMAAGETPSLCDGCAESVRFRVPEAACMVCGVELPPLLRPRERCLRCTRRRPPHERLTVLGDYEGVLKAAIGALKYGREESLARPLGNWLCAWERRLLATNRATPVDLVVPVPLEPSRLRRRGFNQAERIGAALAEGLGLPLVEGALERRRGAGAQVGRSRAERRRLASATFLAVERRVWGRRVLLVDDVVTTGATVRAAARALQRAGALGVRVAAAARTPAERPDLDQGVV